MPFCSHCGKELNEDAAFCPGCGQRLMGFTPEERQKYIDELKASIEEEKTLEQQQEKEIRQEQAEQWSKKYSKVIIAAVIGIIILAAVLPSWLSSGGSSEPESSTLPPEYSIPSTPSNETKTAPPLIANWEVVDLDYKIVEKNETWWKFSWQATLKNNTSSVVEFYITVNFLDRHGFIVDDDIENPPVFSSGEQRVVRGYALIDVDIASDVYDIEATIRAYME